MEITVQVAPDLVGAFEAAAGALGVTPRPLHPGAEDPRLRSYYVVDVPDGATAERVVARLRQSPAVAAAYIKPPDAPA